MPDSDTPLPLSVAFRLFFFLACALLAGCFWVGTVLSVRWSAPWARCPDVLALSILGASTLAYVAIADSRSFEPHCSSFLTAVVVYPWGSALLTGALGIAPLFGRAMFVAFTYSNVPSARANSAAIHVVGPFTSSSARFDFSAASLAWMVFWAVVFVTSVGILLLKPSRGDEPKGSPQGA